VPIRWPSTSGAISRHFQDPQTAPTNCYLQSKVSLFTWCAITLLSKVEASKRRAVEIKMRSASDAQNR
jgi:hypothetical protein